MTSLSYIPAWRSDETLYSWVAGFHVVCGNGSARDTGRLLFDAEHACRERDAPTNLHRFVELTDGKLGDIESLLLNKTSIGLFTPFLPHTRHAAFRARLPRLDGPGWRVLCCMGASALESPVLRFCDECVQEDQVTWGLPRWRLQHQLVGAWICLDHERLLRTMNLSCSAWLLPPRNTCLGNSPPPDRLQVAHLMRLARFSKRMVGAGALDIETIRLCAINALRDQEITGWSHPLDKTLLAAWFSGMPIANWLRSMVSPEHRLASGTWIYDLLRNRCGDHPLKWLLLWSTLFQGESEDASFRRFISPLSVPHWSANGQGQIWSGTTVPADIQDIIANAMTLKDAAGRLGISAPVLRDRLSALGTNPRLYQLTTTYEPRAARAWNAISDYVREHPRCTRSDLHRHCKAAVSWMRANDPDLLANALAQLPDSRSRQLDLPYEQ